MGILELIIKQKPAIKAALPANTNVDRITRMFQTAVRENPKLLECRHDSVLGSIMLCAQLGLDLTKGLNQGFLVPYSNICQFQTGYMGLVNLALRSGLYESIQVREVYADDDFSYEYGLNPKLNHVPRKSMEGEEPIAYYAIYRLKNGGFDFHVMYTENIIEHANKYSKSVNRKDGAWQNSFSGMAKKTVLIKLLKYAPMSIEHQAALTKESKPVVFRDGQVEEYQTIEAEAVKSEAVKSEAVKSDKGIDDLLDGL